MNLLTSLFPIHILFGQQVANFLEAAFNEIGIFIPIAGGLAFACGCVLYFTGQQGKQGGKGLMIAGGLGVAGYYFAMPVINMIQGAAM